MYCVLDDPGSMMASISPLLFVSIFSMTVALALREQILEAGKVPIGEHDWKMDMIVGPDGVVEGAASTKAVDSKCERQM